MKKTLLLIALAFYAFPISAFALSDFSDDRVREAERQKDYRTAVFILVSNLKDEPTDSLAKERMAWLRRIYKAAGQTEKVSEMNGISGKKLTDFLEREYQIADPALTVVLTNDGVLLNQVPEPHSEFTSANVYVVKKTNPEYATYLKRFWWLKTEEEKANIVGSSVEKLRAQAACLRDSDPVYALFKLRQAWDLLFVRSQIQAFNTLRNDLALTYGKIHPDCEGNLLSYNPDQLAMYLAVSPEIDQWNSWRITRRGDGLFLTAPESSLDERSGCLSGMIDAEEIASKDPEQRKQLDAYYAGEAAKLKEKIALLPIIFRPSDKKYQDLLQFAQPISNGETRMVIFDLNPFVPRQFRRMNWPSRIE
jgi:hypothetical protein